jgi:hypothetical protein
MVVTMSGHHQDLRGPVWDPRGPPGPQRGPRILDQQLASWRVEDCAVYVLEEGKKKEISKEVTQRGSHVVAAYDPCLGPLGGQGRAPRGTKVGAQGGLR